MKKTILILSMFLFTLSASASFSFDPGHELTRGNLAMLPSPALTQSPGCFDALVPMVFLGGGLGSSFESTYHTCYGIMGLGILFGVCPSWQAGLGFAYQWDNYNYEDSKEKTSYLSLEPRFNYFPSCLSGAGPMKPYLGLHGDIGFGGTRYAMNGNTLSDISHRYQALVIRPGLRFDFKGPVDLNIEADLLRLQRNYKTSNMAKLDEPYYRLRFGTSATLLSLHLSLALSGFMKD